MTLSPYLLSIIKFLPRILWGFVLRPSLFLLRVSYRLLIFILLLLGFSHYWLPLIEGYQQSIETEAGHFLDNIVSIGSINYDYRTQQPRLVLSDVQLSDKHDPDKFIKIARVSMSFDIKESLRTFRVQPAQILASGVEATIYQNQQGEFHINGLKLPIAGLSSGAGREKPLAIKLNKSTLHWFNAKTQKKFSLYDVTANASVSAENINVNIQASPLASVGKPLSIIAKLQQDHRTAITAPPSQAQSGIASLMVKVSHQNQKTLATPLANSVKNKPKYPKLKYWNGNIQLKGELNDPSALPIDFQKFTGIIDGDLQFQFNSIINRNRPIELKGKLAIQHPVLEQSLHTPADIQQLYHQNVDRLVLDGSWQIKSDYWKAQFLLEVEKNKQKQRSNLHFSQQFNPQGFELNANVDKIDLDNYLPLIERQQWLNHKVATYLQQLKPRGQLENFSLYLNVDQKNPLQATVRGKGSAKNLSIQAYKKFPALQHINAQFDFNRDTGSLWLSSHNNKISYPRWFEAPIEVENFESKITWQRSKRLWIFSLQALSANNADASATGTGQLTLDLDRKTRPLIDFKLNFSGNRTLTNLRRYIPSIIPDGGERWLKQGLKSALVPQGELRLKGRIISKRFPFIDPKKDKFSVWFDVEQGKLVFLPKWPVMQDITGRVSFINRSMQAELTSARILNNKISYAKVDIADFKKKAKLLISQIHSQGKLSEQLALLQASPLIKGKGMTDFLQKSQFLGNSELNLGIELPLKKGRAKKENLKLKGTLQLDNVSANLSSIKQKFTQVSGLVKFDQHGISAKGVSTNYKNSAATLTAKTSKDKKKIILYLQQNNQIKTLMTGMVDVLKPYFSGKTDYQASLELPSYSVVIPKEERHREIALHIDSNLQGVNSHLPKPFSKPAVTAAKFQLDWKSIVKKEPSENSNANTPSKPHLAHQSKHQPYHIQYQAILGKPLVSAIFDSQRNYAQTDQRLFKLGIALGGKSAILPQQGIAINGQLNSTDLFSWRKLIRLRRQPQQSHGNYPVSLNLKIKDLYLAKQSQGQAYISINSKDNQIHAAVKSDKLTAVIKKSPQHWDIQLSHINFDHLKKTYIQRQNTRSMQSAYKSAAINLQAQNFPPVTFTCISCQIKNQKLDRISFNMLKQDKTKHIKINAINIVSKYYQLMAEGHWTSNNLGHSTTYLQLKRAKIYKLGAFLSSFTQKAGLVGGETDITGHISWENHPFALTLYNLSAQLGLHIQKGEFPDVEVGLGKLLGLLNTSQFSRRLKLDFSDLSPQGIPFDKITGDIQIKKGIAETNNTLIESSLMLAGIKGQSHLIKRTHNQEVTVIPNAKSALPSIGLLVGGVGVAATLLLVDRLTDQYEKEQLASNKKDNHIGMRYHIGGAWKEPKISDITPVGAAEDIYAD